MCLCDLFTEEPKQVARLIHLFKADYPDKQYAVRMKYPTNAWHLKYRKNVCDMPGHFR